ncbi:MAG: ABC transporter permease subunit [Oscillatoriales cyanobacterium SM2_2_1]|nr:ABC transporter permease subunit [Oscillatoriales cyanobacterium SM2_2_1]
MNLRISRLGRLRLDGAVAAQVIFLAGLGILLFLGWRNLQSNLQRAGLGLQFDFLTSQASFAIRERTIPYEPTDSYLLALAVGVLNSLKVIAIAIVSATGIGAAVGMARLTPHWLVQQMARVYTELFLNTPLLLQLFFWYVAIFLPLPTVPQGAFGGLWQYSNQGIAIPWLGVAFSSEFLALSLGLSTFSSVFVAELVRGSVLAISQGQWEAGLSLGLNRWQVLRLVVLPQAWRILIPPLTNQYLNIIKNSSLAIAVGYEDVYAIASTTINQTGRPVNVIVILMGIYLVLCLTVAWGMGELNRRVQLVER